MQRLLNGSKVDTFRVADIFSSGGKPMSESGERFADLYSLVDDYDAYVEFTQTYISALDGLTPQPPHLTAQSG